MPKGSTQKVPIQTDFDTLKARLSELAHFSSVIALLDWDKQVYMPKHGAELRAATFSYLAGLLHQRFVELDADGLLERLRHELNQNKLDADQTVVVREVVRTFDREKKLPQKFVQEMAETVARAHGFWEEAKKSGKFQIFAPHLEKIIALKKEEARLVGYKDSPYDALLDPYEPGMTAAQLEPLFADLREFLVELLKKIKKSKVRQNPKMFFGNFPLDRQRKLNELVAAKIGFNFSAGRLDESTHPFTITINPGDVRVTSRFNPRDVLYSISPTLHEAGHALYEQGLPSEHFGTPLADPVSLGIHESQSRLWENLVGLSLPFWKYFYPKLRKEFPKPFGKISLADFYQNINVVKPSLIRIEADEVTYNLHIIIRFEIEKGLIEGVINPADLPKIWNQKYKEYLGVTVPNNGVGVLQDVHWSSGLFGYFPTYTLGNLYSAQFYAAAKHVTPNLEKAMEKGDFSKLLNWLRRNIHVHGRRFSAADLVREATGEKLKPEYYKKYLAEKYSKIYRLE